MRRSRLLTLSIPAAVVAAAVLATAPAASAAQPAVGLGTATSFAVLGGTTVTNTGPTTISGDVGVAPGTAVVGFPPALVSGGSIHAADAVALQAQSDLTTAYVDAAGRGPAVDETGKDLGGQRLLPGVYNAASSMALTGTVTLDGLGDPAAVFVLQAGSTLTTASNATVVLTGAAQPCNVFWQVGSSATIGTTTRFVGSVMALTSITMQTGASVEGRLLARNGQVELDSNVITRPTCATVPTVTPTATAAPSAVPSASATPTSKPSSKPSSQPSGKPSGKPSSGSSPRPSGTSSPSSPSSTQTSTASSGNGGGEDSDGTVSGPVVPTGHPETGRLPTGPGHSSLWLGGALLSTLGAGGAAVAGARRRR